MNYLGLPKRSSDEDVSSAATSIGVDVTPNPFINFATIKVRLMEAGDLKVDIHDILGGRIRTIYDGMSEGGTRFFTWNGLNEHGSQVPSGIYLCRIKNGNNETFVMLNNTR
jgi:flagellar hook assembly protein FlgD